MNVTVFSIGIIMLQKVLVRPRSLTAMVPSAMYRSQCVSLHVKLVESLHERKILKEDVEQYTNEQNYSADSAKHSVTQDSHFPAINVIKVNNIENSSIIKPMVYN